MILNETVIYNGKRFFKGNTFLITSLRSRFTFLRDAPIQDSRNFNFQQLSHEKRSIPSRPAFRRNGISLLPRFQNKAGETEL